jgi:beta-galactosidase
VHNFMQLYTGFDHHAVAADLDVASWDSYPIGALEMFWFGEDDKQRWLRTGHPDFTAFHHDLYRGMSRQPFWVMEQQPGPVNWARWNPAPAPGMVRLWTWEAFAHGAEVVSYFRWRQAPFGQEQMHAGLQTPDRRLDQGGREASIVAAELGKLARLPAQASGRAPVALVFDYESLWLLDVHPQGADYNGLRLAFEAYSALRSLALDVDIVPAGADLSAYRLVVLPAMPLVGSELLRRLEATAAQVVLYPRAGSKRQGVRIPEELPPGSLQRLIDLRVPRVESLRPGVQEPVYLDGTTFGALRWRETLEHGPGVLAEARFADGATAVARQGRTRYLAGWFDPALQLRVLERAAHDAGLETTRLPGGVRVRRRGELLFAFNYGQAPHELRVPGARWVLGSGRLAPHGLGIARRRPA